MRTLKFREMEWQADSQGVGTLHRNFRRALAALSFTVLIAALPATDFTRDAEAHQVPPDSPPPSGEVTAPDVVTEHPATTPGAIPAVASVGPASTAPAAESVTESTTPGSAGAQKPESSPTNAPFTPFGGNQKGPVNIQSDGLNLDYKNNWVLFHGHVHAVQGGGVLTSDTLKVKYGKDFSDMQEMYADGNVKISQGTRYATSDHAVLDQSVHTVTLTGNPVVHDGNDRVVGQKIVVNLITGKSDVTGGAKAWFFPRDSKSPNNESAANGSAD
ncbi:MAG TPA: LptA/OstA family protein [Candidatus Binataceae bacterium]|nr:LptA/OstA family protein [Candidatus Binataceae bacterium]